VENYNYKTVTFIFSKEFTEVQWGHTEQPSTYSIFIQVQFQLF